MQDAVVKYFDGTTVETAVSQYDLVQFERSRVYVADRSALAGRFMAYSALRRTGALPMDPAGRAVSWETWDRSVDEVEILEEDDPDPTQQDQSGES